MVSRPDPRKKKAHFSLETLFPCPTTYNLCTFLSSPAESEFVSSFEHCTFPPLLPFPPSLCCCFCSCFFFLLLSLGLIVDAAYSNPTSFFLSFLRSLARSSSPSPYYMHHQAVNTQHYHCSPIMFIYRSAAHLLSLSPPLNSCRPSNKLFPFIHWLDLLDTSH